MSTPSALDPRPRQRVERVKELTDGVGAHVVMDLVGVPSVIPEGLEMLRQGGGCYLEVGSIAPGNVFSYDATALVRGNARLVGHVELLAVGARGSRSRS